MPFDYLNYTDYHSFPGGWKKLHFIMEQMEAYRQRANKEKISVLDVGCGNGSLSFPLAFLKFTILGVDIDSGSIDYCKKSNPFPNASFQLVSPLLEEVKGSFDIIVCSEVLEHLPQPQSMLQRLNKLLKPEGILIITIPNGYGPREVLGRWERWLRTKLRLDRIIEAMRSALGMIPEKEKHQMHTSNPYQEHIQKFLYAPFRKLLANSGLHIKDSKNSIFIFSVFARSKSGNSWLDRLDGWLADRMPPFMVSGWYIVCGK